MSRLWSVISAALYDPFLMAGERRGMRALRARLLAGASGRVLEIGAGTGLNVVHYGEDVEELVLTESDDAMLRRLRRRAASRPGVTVTPARAEALPFPDASFDAVVSTLVLCTVPDAEAAVAELGRVLRPGGRLLFIEHVRAPSARLARWQDRLNAPWRAFAAGCNCNRPTLDLLQAGFRLGEVARGTWRSMPFIVRPLVAGAAVRS